MSAAVPEQFGGSPVMDRAIRWTRRSDRSQPQPGTLLTAMQQQPVVIRDIAGDPVLCHRLLELGFTPGQAVTVMAAAPLGGPLAVGLRGTILALRRAEAACILL